MRHGLPRQPKNHPQSQNDYETKIPDCLPRWNPQTLSSQSHPPTNPLSLPPRLGRPATITPTNEKDTQNQKRRSYPILERKRPTRSNSQNPVCLRRDIFQKTVSLKSFCDDRETTVRRSKNDVLRDRAMTGRPGVVLPPPHRGCRDGSREKESPHFAWPCLAL
jgi:hypothetical protein